MLKTILSVSGKPGLYKLVSSGKNMIIVESLIDKRKMPIHTRDKVVSLGDISIYTDENEVPLGTVFTSIKVKENGEKASVATSAKPEELKKYLEEILPSFDRERVYPTDIKKMISWYNILIEAGIDFSQAEIKTESEDEITSEDEKVTSNIAIAKKGTTKKTSAPKNSAAPKTNTKSKAPKATAPRKAQ